VVPIGLDTVLRLAEEQNPQIALARARVEEAFADRDVAKARWLPDLYVGPAYYRHEGGIQNEDGTLTHSSTGAMFAGMEIDGKLDIHQFAYQKVNAERKAWQQRGEMARVTSEVLLEASTTYIDLLAAHTGEQVAHELGAKLQDLLQRAQKLASTEPAARIHVARIQAQLEAERQSALKLRSQSSGAAAKLVYLLGLDPASQLVPVDRQLVAFDLVDAGQPIEDLIAKAQTSGPGVQELEGLLRLVQDSIERSKGPAKFLPTFELRMAEGGFGAGPGDDMRWDNRWDLGLQARWNLTEPWTVQQRRRVSQAKVSQLYLTQQDLHAKLAAGVLESRETTLEGREQINLGEAQMRDALSAYDLSYLRLREAFQSTSYTEALLALHDLATAKSNYIQAISAYDKAQLRLMVLLGPGNCHRPSLPADG
jgi:outer membrane protein TolC